MSGGLFLVVFGIAVAAVGLLGILRRLPPIRPRRPEDGISLIEFAISAVDPNFVPAGEMRLERKLNKLICWFGLFVGLSMVGLGLAYGDF